MLVIATRSCACVVQAKDMIQRSLLSRIGDDEARPKNLLSFLMLLSQVKSLEDRVPILYSNAAIVQGVLFLLICSVQVWL